MNETWRGRLKLWRERPGVSWLLSRSIRPFYRIACWIVRGVPWAIRVNGGAIVFDGIPLVFPANVGVTYCTLGWWQGAAGYEPATWRTMKACLQVADVFWDVGSNIGLYSALARKIRPTLRVMAFEPVPALAAAHRKFQKANGSGVEVAEIAVSDHRGSAEITIRKYADVTEVEPTSTLESGINLSQGACATVLNVPTTTLDAESATLRADDRLFIKIDVEGHESHVLAGARLLLKKYRPLVLCEILPGVGRIDELSQIIAEVRYELLAICHEGLFRVTAADMKKKRCYTDYLLMPEELMNMGVNYYDFEGLPG